MIEALRDSFVMTPPAPNTPAERRDAVLYVASNAHDAADCTQLLDMLGLTAADARGTQIVGTPSGDQGERNAKAGTHNLRTSLADARQEVPE